MPNDTTDLESVIQNIENLSKTSIDLLKFKSVDKTADITSGVLSRMVLILIFLFFFLFLNIAFACWLSEYLHSYCLGFLYTSIGYAVLFILALVLRKHLIKTPIANFIINHLLKD